MKELQRAEGNQECPRLQQSESQESLRNSKSNVAFLI